MPYASDSQRRKFHAMEARGEISKKTVEHWDKASKGKKLPEKVEDGQEKTAAVSALTYAVMLRKKADAAEDFLNTKANYERRKFVGGGYDPELQKLVLSGYQPPRMLQHSRLQALEASGAKAREASPVSTFVGSSPFVSSLAGAGLGAGLGALVAGRKRRLLGALLGGLGGGAIGYGLSAYLKSRMAPGSNEILASTQTTPSPVHPAVLAASDAEQARKAAASKPAAPAKEQPLVAGTKGLEQAKVSAAERERAKQGFDPRTGLSYQ